MQDKSLELQTIMAVMHGLTSNVPQAVQDIWASDIYPHTCTQTKPEQPVPNIPVDILRRRDEKNQRRADAYQKSMRGKADGTPKL